MISVVRRKLITSELSFLTSAPMTPSDVRRRYSKGRDLDVVLRKGYRKRGIWAAGAVVSRSQCQEVILVQHTIQEQASSLAVTSNALKQGECITDSVGGRCCELRGIQQRIY